MSETFDHMTLGSVLRDRASVDPDRPFVSYHDPRTGRIRDSMTYGSARSEIAERQKELRHSGVQPGDRVMLYMENSADHVLSLLSIVDMGAVAVPASLRFSNAKLAEFIDGSECSAIVTCQERFATIESITAKQRQPLPVIVGRKTEPGRRARRTPASSSEDESALPGPRSDPPRSRRVLPGHRTALLVRNDDESGGVTSFEPSHARCLMAGAAVQRTARLVAYEGVYCALPLYRVNAICLQLAPVLLAGGHLIVGSGDTGDDFWELVDEHRVALSYLSVSVLRKLLSAPIRRAAVENRMRVMLCTPPPTASEISTTQKVYQIRLYAGWDLAESMVAGTDTAFADSTDESHPALPVPRQAPGRPRRGGRAPTQAGGPEAPDLEAGSAVTDE